MANGDKVNYTTISLWATVIAAIIGGMAVFSGMSDKQVKAEHRDTTQEAQIQQNKEDLITPEAQAMHQVDMAILQKEVERLKEQVKKHHP